MENISLGVKQFAFFLQQTCYFFDKTVIIMTTEGFKICTFYPKSCSKFEKKANFSCVIYVVFWVMLYKLPRLQFAVYWDGSAHGLKFSKNDIGEMLLGQNHKAEKSVFIILT